jgi:tetratricopeptide (TPR) repeat protein
MLASGDWYTSQMARKVYNSDKLPLTIPASKYKSGEQNYVPVLNRYKSAELKDAVGFVNSNDSRTKIQLQTGEWINFFPTKNVTLTINKEAALKSGTVLPEDSNKIVNKISWTIKQSGLFRNDLMLLDLVSTNNWQRPIYFANVSSVSKVLNVDNYCHMEGIVSRFTPVKSDPNVFIKNIGGVNTERSWKILMSDKARWGRLNEKDVTVDRESYRNTAMAKQSYMRLAQALVNEQKYDSAVQALDRGLYFFPYDKFIFDYFTIPWAEFYYISKAIDKGDDVMKKIVKRYTDDLDYYFSLDEKFITYYSNDIQEAFAVLQRASQVAKQYGRNDLAKQFDKDLNDRIINFR